MNEESDLILTTYNQGLWVDSTPTNFFSSCYNDDSLLEGMDWRVVITYIIEEGLISENLRNKIVHSRQIL